MYARWSDFDGSEFAQSFLALQDLVRQMDGAVRHQPRPPHGSDAHWLAANLYDRGDEVVLFAAVPGFAEKDIQLTATGDSITVTGERVLQAPEGYSAHRRERANLHFSRTFSLPCKVDLDKVAAVVKDGILTVRLGKAADAKPRQIPVNAGA